MYRFLLVLAAVCLLMSCGRSNTGQVVDGTPSLPVASPSVALTPTPDMGQMTVSEARQRWKQADLSSYRIMVREVHGLWSVQDTSLTVTDGEITAIETKCSPAPTQGGICTPQPIEPVLYMVDGLFLRATELLEANPTSVTLSYDPRFGYPATIAYDNPDLIDEETNYAVELFEPLKGRSASEIGDLIVLHVGESYQVDGLRLTFNQISEDSRCPNSVNCAEAGRVVALFKAEANGQPAETIELSLVGNGLPTQQPVVVADRWHVQLFAVTPYPASPETTITAQAYRVFVRVGAVAH